MPKGSTRGPRRVLPMPAPMVQQVSQRGAVARPACVLRALKRDGERHGRVAAAGARTHSACESNCIGDKAGERGGAARAAAAAGRGAGSTARALSVTVTSGLAAAEAAGGCRVRLQAA